jgi:GNAT superfamily N-acetyltransferase
MAIFGKLDRREFLTLSSLTAAAVMLPHSLHATESAGSGLVSLQVNGDAQRGYGVAILYRGKVIARHHQGGEFSAIFQNSERSLEDRADEWKATSWSGDGKHLNLIGKIKLANLRTTVFVEVGYEVLPSQVVKKTIKLRQEDMYSLLYQITNRLEPEAPPAKLWSFDHADCKGGALHEYFPAAGFRTSNGVTVGLLTDSGYRNQWSRIIRRDGTPVKLAPASIQDLNLYLLPTAAECAQKGTFIQQTFGESTVQLSGEGSRTRIDLPAPSQWKNSGNIQVEQHDGIVKLSPNTAKDYVLLPFAAKGGEIYSVRFKYRSAVPIAVHAWDTDDQYKKLGDITLFNDTAAESPTAFTEFRHSFVVPALQGTGVGFALSPTDYGEAAKRPSGKLPSIEVRDLEIFRITTQSQPYHRLEMGHAQAKTVFVFANDAVPDTLGGYRLASQLHLADGLGFKGGETERVLYADVMMLSWSADIEGQRPMLAPSIWYSAAGEMYLRDSFYALNGIHNRELNEKVFSLWADNQGDDGAINTLVEPSIANLERKSNDSTPLWLMWALLNRRRFGTKLPMDKVQRAAEYCMAAYDPDRDGICSAKFVMGQLDVIQYPEGTSILCENQGMLAILLRVIRELQVPGLSASISDNYIAKAEEAYRSYYDANLGFMRPARNIGDGVGFADIFPEFLSLWLYKRKILTDAMVVSHLNHIPVMLPRKDCPFPGEGGSVRPIFIGLSAGQKEWSYFTEKWHPMVSDAYAASYADKAMDGVYYNGGSWMRIEVCGYVTGKLHGWKPAERAIANRLWAEIHTDEDFPTSQEYLPTETKNPFYGYHRVFAWNSFVLQALEMAQLRSPEMDPEYKTPAHLSD